MQKIAFIDFWNATPHLQTAFELAKLHLDRGDHVSYYFAGHDLIVTQDVNFFSGVKGYKYRLPELVGAQLLKGENFKFHRRCNLKIYETSCNLNFETIDELIKYKYKNFSIGSAVFNTLIDLTKQVDIEIGFHGSRIQALIIDAINCYEFAHHTLSSQNIDVLYVFNGRFINTAAVTAAAQNLNVEVYFHERGSSKDKYFLEKFNTLNLSEMQKATHSTWDESYSLNSSQAKEIASNFFINTRKGLERNWLSYTKSQKKNLLPKFSAKKKIVSYFSTCDDEYLAIDGWDWDSSDWKDQYSGVLTLIDLCKTDKSIELFIRLHPNLVHKSKSQQAKWNNLAKIKEVTIINADSKIDTYGLVEASDLVITSSSTVGIESVYWGTPAVLLGPSYYSSLEAVYIAKTKDVLRCLLKSNSLIANRDASLPYGFFWSTFGTPHLHYKAHDFFDGHFLGVDLKGQKIKNLIVVILDVVNPILNWKNFEKNVVSELDADLAILVVNSWPDISKSKYWTNSKFKFEMSTLNQTQVKDVLIREFLLNKIADEGLDDIYDNLIFTSPKFHWVGPHPPIEFLKKDESWVHAPEEEINNQHLVIKSEDIRTFLSIRNTSITKKVSLPFPCIMYSTQKNNMEDTLLNIPAPINLCEFYTAMSNFAVINTENSWGGIFEKIYLKGGFSPSFLLMDRYFNTLDINLNTNKKPRLKYNDSDSAILKEIQSDSCLMMKFVDNDAFLFDSLDDLKEPIYKIFKFNALGNKLIWLKNGESNKAIGLNSSGYFTRNINEIVSPPLVLDLVTLSPIIEAKY
jgi:hypothetical protein